MLPKFKQYKNFLLVEGANGQGEAILRLEDARAWVKELNNNFPTLNHEIFEDEFSHLYMIKWSERKIIRKEKIKIVI